MSEKTREIVHHLEWFTVLATIIGGFFLLSNRMDSQVQRTDRLYEMFIELVKERR